MVSQTLGWEACVEFVGRGKKGRQQASYRPAFRYVQLLTKPDPVAHWKTLGMARDDRVLHFPPFLAALSRPPTVCQVGSQCSPTNKGRLYRDWSNTLTTFNATKGKTTHARVTAFVSDLVLSRNRKRIQAQMFFLLRTLSEIMSSGMGVGARETAFVRDVRIYVKIERHRAQGSYNSRAAFELIDPTPPTSYGRRAAI